MPFRFIYLINGISLLAVAATAFYIFFVWHKRKEIICKTGKIVGVSGFFYLISGLLNLLWAFDFLKQGTDDFILIKSTFVIIETVLFLFIVYEIIQDKRLLYLLFLFLLSIVGFQQSVAHLFLLILGSSFLLMLLISLDLVLFSNFYLKRAGLIGIVYSYVSIFFLILIFLGADPSNMMWFIPAALMFFIYLFLFFDIKYCGIAEKREAKEKKYKKARVVLGFAKFFIFITAISVFIFF